MRYTSAYKKRFISILCLCTILINIRSNDQNDFVEKSKPIKIVPPSEIFLEINTQELRNLPKKNKLNFLKEFSKILPVQIDENFPIKEIDTYSWRSSLPKNSADKATSIAWLKTGSPIEQDSINNYFKRKLQGDCLFSENFDSKKAIFQSSLTENKNALTVVYLNDLEILIGSPSLLNDWDHKTDQLIFENYKKEKYFIFFNIKPSYESKKYFEFISDAELKKGNLKTFNLYQLISSSNQIEITANIKKDSFHISLNVKYEENDNSETLTALLYGLLNYSGVSATTENKESLLKIKKDSEKKSTQIEVQLTIEQASKLLR